MNVIGGGVPVLGIVGENVLYRRSIASGMVRLDDGECSLVVVIGVRWIATPPWQPLIRKIVGRRYLFSAR